MQSQRSPPREMPRSDTPEAATLAFEEDISGASGMHSMDVAVGETGSTFRTAEEATPNASTASFAAAMGAISVNASAGSASMSMGPFMAALEAARTDSGRLQSFTSPFRRPGTPIPSKVKQGSSLETLESVTASLLGAAPSADLDAESPARSDREEADRPPGIWRRISSAVFGRSVSVVSVKEERARASSLSSFLSPPTKRDRQASSHGRARGTVSPATGHEWADHGGRARRIRAVDLSVARSSPGETRSLAPSGSVKDALLVAPGPAAMHRALDTEWSQGIALIGSVRARAIDADVHDATAVAAYFALTDVFTLAYFGALERRLGGGEATSRERAAAAETLARFAGAREAFLDTQGVEAVDRLADAAQAAQAAVLASTNADARAHMLSDLGVAPLARAFATHGDAGPLLVLLFARGIVDDAAERARWARGVLFPQRFRRPRRFGCMKKVAATLVHVHDEHALVASRAEEEYRAMFESRAWDRESQLLDLDERMQCSSRAIKVN